MNQTHIIDVRSPQEFAAGHVRDAVNIPLDQISQSIGAVSGLEKNSEILVYCHSGMRSAVACSILAQMGFAHVANGGSMAAVMMKLQGAAS